MIDHDTVQRIIDTAKIDEIVSDFISLKRRGVNYLGNCPFHDEKTPSFTVSPAKGIFKCFGCGKGGNSVNFVMEHEQLTYVDALRWIAKKYNIEIIEQELNPEEARKKTARDSMLVLNSFAQKFFSETLTNHQEGKAVGLTYFKQRKFRDDIIQKFQLGFCPSDKDAFTSSALKNGYRLEYLEQTGLTIVKEDYQADRFRGRVMFPIHSISGQVIGFGGRILKTDPEKKLAKYVNSPQSEIYDKSKTLYGIYFAKNSIVKEDRCFLVEGYTDVMSMHQAGIENVVAASGTSLTEQQIMLILRLTKNITIIFDGDPAGIKASIRGIDMVLKAGMNVKILLLPDNDDPDSFSHKHSSEELKKYIKDNEEDFIKFKTRLLLGDVGNDPVKKAGLISDIVNTISVIPNEIAQSVYIKECSKLMDINEDIIISEIQKINKRNIYQDDSKYIHTKQEYKAPTQTPPQTISKDSYCDSQEKEIVRLLLMYGFKEFHVDNNPDIKKVKDFFHFELIVGNWQLLNEGLRGIFEEYFNQVDIKGEEVVRFFINHPDSDISSYIADVLSEKYTLSKLWQKKDSYVVTEDLTLNILIPQTILMYKKKRIEVEILKLSESLKTLTEASEIGEVHTKILALMQIQKNLAKDINSPL